MILFIAVLPKLNSFRSGHACLAKFATPLLLIQQLSIYTLLCLNRLIEY